MFKQFIYILLNCSSDPLFYSSKAFQWHRVELNFGTDCYWNDIPLYNRIDLNFFQNGYAVINDEWRILNFRKAHYSAMNETESEH